MVFNHSGEGDELARRCRCAAWTTPATTGCGRTGRTSTSTTPAAATPWRSTGRRSLRWRWTRCAPGPARRGRRLPLRPGHGAGPARARFRPRRAAARAIDQDPELRRLKLIAEPWDFGPGGYQLGRFPAGWGEWNDRFRDTVRRFWRGDGGTLGDLATRLAGSPDALRRPPPAHRSVNFVTAHDGFTLADLVAFTQAQPRQRRGEPRRLLREPLLEPRRRGSHRRPRDPRPPAADVRALLATLLLARGTPMLAMGDELGHSQGGNNNAYAQDNAIPGSTGQGMTRRWSPTPAGWSAPASRIRRCGPGHG